MAPRLALDFDLFRPPKVTEAAVDVGGKRLA
jgi:hypothetical protein